VTREKSALHAARAFAQQLHSRTALEGPQRTDAVNHAGNQDDTLVFRNSN
jgi:hypothetical protein